MLKRKKKFKRNKRHEEEFKKKKKSYARSHGLFLGLLIGQRLLAQKITWLNDLCTNLKK